MYRHYLAGIDTHPWAQERIRNLTLRNSAGDCLSSLYLHTVQALHEDQTIQLGGIARVITPERLRGLGYAAQLIRVSLDHLTREGYDGAYLISEIDPRYYERFGFTTVNSLHINVPLDTLPSVADSHSVRNVRNGDWPTIRSIHADAGQGEALWLLRDPAHWDYLLERRFCYSRHTRIGNPEPLYLVVERQSQIIGYALAVTESNTLQLLELILRSPGDRTAFNALLGALRSRAESRGCTNSNAPWPPGKWQKLYTTHFDPSDRSSGFLMIKSLNSRLDSQSVIERCRGSWHTDHI
jgi:hypothetical protein